MSRLFALAAASCLSSCATHQPGAVLPYALPPGLTASLAPLVAQVIGDRTLEATCLGAFTGVQGGEMAFVVRDSASVSLYVATLTPDPAVLSLMTTGSGAPVELQCLPHGAVDDRNTLITATETVSGHIDMPESDAICATDASGVRFVCFGMQSGGWRLLGGWTT